MKKVKIALLGLGTVGCGVVKGLARHEAKIERTIGTKIELTRVLVRNPHKKRNIELPSAIITTSFDEILSDPGITVVIEAMGGLEPTYTYVKQALNQGCHLITANKALIARYGAELHELASSKGVHLFYEASVGGAIPILSTLRHFLKVNEVNKVYGILNGTTNYILTKMLEREEPYEKILQEAQSLGYAESDPTADVEGFDALHKLAILTNLCFGLTPELDRISRKGITDISLQELKLASSMGFTIKLIASAETTKECLRLKVAPALLPHSHPLAPVSDVLNAVCIQSDLAGELTFSGRGAGELPTASAVLEDLLFLLQNTNSKTNLQSSVNNLAIDYTTEAHDYFFYLHVPEKQAPELLGKLIRVLQKEGIHVHEITQIPEKAGLLSIGAIITCTTKNDFKVIQKHFDHQLTIREALVLKEKPVHATSVNL